MGRIVAFVFVYKQFTIRVPVRLRSAILSVWLHPLQINCSNSRCNVSMGLYIYPDAMLAWNFFLHESILTFGNLKRMFSIRQTFISYYRIAGMFRRVKVSFLKEKTIFMGFISIHSFHSISITGFHLLTG